MEWITFLEGKLAAKDAEIRRNLEYYDADEKVLAFAQRKFAEEFGHLFFNWRDNFCGVVIDAMTERMHIDGFRFGDNPDADEEAQRIWQTNCLDAESGVAHTDALVAGESYLAVWGDEDDEPIITPESGLEVVVQYAPGSRRKLDAGLKKYYDDWGGEHVSLWLPDDTKTGQKAGLYTTRRGSGKTQWEDLTREENPLRVVPLVPLLNRPRLGRKRPWSELKPIIPIQDAITKIVADAIVSSEFNSYPQRILSGIELPEDDDGNVIAPVQAAVDRLLLFEDPDVKWGQFATGDVTQYEALVTMLVMHLASISRTPSHYFAGGGGMSSNSGEFTQSREAGLIAKVKDRETHFGEGWEQAMRLAFKVKGDARAEEVHAETIWADPEYRSEGQRIDALVKLNQGLGVPMRQLWEDAGYSPAQIARFRDMQEEEHKLQLQRQVEMAEAMPQPALGQAPGKPQAGKPQAGNSGNDNRKMNKAA